MAKKRRTGNREVKKPKKQRVEHASATTVSELVKRGQGTAVPKRK